MLNSYWRAAAGVLALACGGGAGLSAQTFPFGCASQTQRPNLVRSNGVAELTADIVLTCRGGAAGPNLPTTFTVFLSAVVTGKISSGTSEALLLINEPAPGDQVPGVNVIQGVVSAPAQLTFSNVSLPQAGPNGFLALRFTNMRVNASMLTAPADVQAFVTESSHPGFDIQVPLTTVATLQPGMTSRLRTAQDTVYGGAAFSQCTPVNPGLAQSPAAPGGIVNFNVQFSEGSVFAFAPRQNAATAPPNSSALPGFPRSGENGFYNPALPAAGGLNVAGLASQGTRLRMQFNAIPPGVSLFVTVTPSPFGTSAGVRPRFDADQIGLAGAHLTAADANGGGPYTPVAPTSTVLLNGVSVGIAPLTVVNGVATAAWEILQSDPNSIEDVSFGVLLAYNGQPAPASIRMARSLAPISGDPAIDANIVPRFIDSDIASQLVIGACGAALPDLQITSLSAPSTPGAGTGITVSATVFNNSPTSVSSPVEIAYSLFEDPNLSRPVVPSTRAVCSLPGVMANSSAPCPVNLDIPGRLKPGAYYLGAFADDLGQIPESNESNNTASIPLTIFPCSVFFTRPLVELGHGANLQGIVVHAGNGCLWSAVSDVPWITVLSGETSGPGVLSFKVDADTGPLGRTGSLLVAAGENLLVAHAGAGSPSQIRVFRGGAWFADANLNHGWDGSSTDKIFSFGVPGDIPVMGDWSGSGEKRLGIYRNGSWFVDLRGFNDWAGPIGSGAIFSFGVPGDIPVVGDWSGSGQSEIGVYRNGLWFVDMNGNHQWDGTGPGGDAIFSFGVPGDIPIVGDWDGSGQLKIGVYRNGLWYVDLNGNHQWDGTGPGGDAIFSFGVPGDIPVVGDWDGSGQLKIGIYRNGLWFVDMNGNHQWDGTAGGDAIFLFGVAGDLPIAATR